ncbi:hypothetical protein ABIB34_001927 [Rhodococcus sp. UYP5]
MRGPAGDAALVRVAAKNRGARQLLIFGATNERLYIALLQYFSSVTCRRAPGMRSTSPVIGHSHPRRKHQHHEPEVGFKLGGWCVFPGLSIGLDATHRKNDGRPECKRAGENQNRGTR